MKNYTHLAITCIAYAYFGFGWAVEIYGMKAGLSSDATTAIFCTAFTFYLVVMLTSLEKVTKIIKESDSKTPVI